MRYRRRFRLIQGDWIDTSRVSIVRQLADREACEVLIDGTWYRYACPARWFIDCMEARP